MLGDAGCRSREKKRKGRGQGGQAIRLKREIFALHAISPNAKAIAKK
jgi:hypothetical protein